LIFFGTLLFNFNLNILIFFTTNFHRK
jgi:hypothetical protein